MDAYLGLDTSCYTTSLCLVDAAFHILADERIILSVPSGSRGLSQSNMVYQHMRNLPVLFERLRQSCPDYVIQAVGVTDAPRRREDSYMPAFLAGLGYARSLASVLQVPLHCISHQENHVLAVLRDLGAIDSTPFYGLHVSGGTTDLMRIVPDAQGLAITRVGGTSDISAGQFIDRVGVALGLPFPAGVHVDELARTSGRLSAQKAHVFCRDGEVSFSGPESQAQRRIAAGNYRDGDMCAWTLAAVWDGLRRMLESQNEMACLVAAGGVMSNSYLQRQLKEYCLSHDIILHLAPQGYSADNSSGAAFWAAWQERGRV
ncbi:peptidase [uncultured Megasphaera sp.]|uniref:peptidase n=1 Tax=uncultured Megasphaera sp. TaxID=165188 RepID=UPI002658B091|nr:peptidase [uncultured Megasphaera sp.]